MYRVKFRPILNDDVRFKICSFLKLQNKSNELLLLCHGVFDTVQVDSSMYDDISDRFVSV